MSETEQHWDVFISAQHTDYPQARQLHEYLASWGVKSFFSPSILRKMGRAEYRSEIDQALDSATHMIVVASSVENIKSHWVEAEWGGFINELRSGRKSGNLLTVIIGTMKVGDLPFALRQYEVVPFDPSLFENLLPYVASTESLAAQAELLRQKPEAVEQARQEEEQRKAEEAARQKREAAEREQEQRQKQEAAGREQRERQAAAQMKAERRSRQEAERQAAEIARLEAEAGQALEKCNWQQVDQALKSLARKGVEGQQKARELQIKCVQAQREAEALAHQEAEQRAAQAEEAATAHPAEITSASPEQVADTTDTKHITRRQRQKLMWAGAGALVCTALIYLLTLTFSSIPSHVNTPTPVPTLTPSPTPPKTTAEMLSPSNTPAPMLTPSPTSSVGSMQISPKDGMAMMYVPEGEFLMGSEDGESDEKPQHTVSLGAFWIDQTEVTNAMYAQCAADGECKLPRATKSYTRSNYYDGLQYADYPVINVDWSQANAYCGWAGRRLPTEAEWEKAARSTDGRTYPWGEGIDCSLANYQGKNSEKDFCIGDTQAVGRYPQGVSEYGALDMAGNVWEWVADWYSETYYIGSPSGNPQGPASGQSRVLRGGSWFFESWYLRSSDRGWFDPVGRDLYVGFRCAGTVSINLPAPVLTVYPTATAVVATANAAATKVAQITSTASATSIATHLPPTTTPKSSARFTPTLTIGLTQVNAKDGMLMVYVPAGEFIMGSETYADEKPQRTVTLEAFWIDQTEVTNGMYARCMESGTCRATGSGRTTIAGYENYPVVVDNWEQAQAYCEWAGRRLPLEVEWEKAARGTDGRTYPWGEEANCGQANYGGCKGEVQPVGSYPDYASPYRALDMAGNLWEYVKDMYPDTTDHILKGGDWFAVAWGVRAAVRGGGGDMCTKGPLLWGRPWIKVNGFDCATWTWPTYRSWYAVHYDYGLRCALSP